MCFKKFISLILLLSYLVLTLGCTQRVSIREPEQYWWIEEKTWVKVKGHKQWLKVIKVEADSVYGKIPNISSTVASDSLAVLHLSAVALIKKEQINTFGTLLSGIVIGAFIGFVVLAIHIGASFDSDSEIF